MVGQLGSMVEAEIGDGLRANGIGRGGYMEGRGLWLCPGIWLC